ncbi:MAG TPA: UDP-3-O-acyl-N-acetylglucosamine deacetylase [Alphaproteobacteria bacterium]|nr:UDP-3-O-acyl-N-acetylglucosamine deacetylase [Alphaproteobacteria bacterium]
MKPAAPTRLGIAKPISLEGVGVHTGVRSGVTLLPGSNGISVARVDGRRKNFAISPTTARPSPLCTLLVGSTGATLSTVEHLFSALHGMGVTDVMVEVDGPEVPILDGSALPWVTALETAGLTPLPGPLDTLKVASTVPLADGARTLFATPAGLFSVRCTIDFDHPMIGHQSWSGTITPERYKKEIAPARTFITEDELKLAQEAGFAKGATLEGGVLFLNDGTVANPGGLRFEDEPVRHKVLDAIGDLFMAGKPVVGAFTLNRPGHTANNALLRKLV